MIPETLDLEIYRGNDYVHQLVFNDDAEPPAPVDLSDYTFKAQIRDRPENGQILHAEFTIATTDADEGIIVLSLPAEATQIPQGYWDLEVTYLGMTVTWLKGEVIMSGDVTKTVEV